MTPDDRRTMCSWCYQIVDSCSIDRSVACVGMSYLDRFMCTPSHRATSALASRREYQLAAVCCLVVALKCRGGIKVGTDFVADSVCRGLYDADELDGMEMDVLGALGWRLNGPSPHDYVDAIVSLLPRTACHDVSNAASSLASSAKTHVEAAMLDYCMATQPSSSLAYAALLTSLQRTTVMSDLRASDLFAWVPRVASVIGGGGMDLVFVRGLTDIARERLTSSSSSLSSSNPSRSPVLVDGGLYVNDDDAYCRGKRLEYEDAIHRCSPTWSMSSSIHAHEYGGEGDGDDAPSIDCVPLPIGC